MSHNLLRWMSLVPVGVVSDTRGSARSVQPCGDDPRVSRSGQATGRSKVTRTPSTPPGPTRPLTSTAVIALSCQPWAAC